jgi:hypothetical protein
MKPHPEMTTERLLQSLRDQMDGGEISVVGREGSSVELAEARAAMQAAISEHLTKVLALCPGCGEKKPLHLCNPCECGQMVCDACRQVETEGECHHEPPDLPKE